MNRARDCNCKPYGRSGIASLSSALHSDCVVLVWYCTGELLPRCRFEQNVTPVSLSQQKSACSCRVYDITGAFWIFTWFLLVFFLSNPFPRMPRGTSVPRGGTRQLFVSVPLQKLLHTPLCTDTTDSVIYLESQYRHYSQATDVQYRTNGSTRLCQIGETPAEYSAHRVATTVQ